MLSGFELYPRWVPLMYRETLKYFSCAPATKFHDYWKKKKQTKAIKEQQQKETKTKKTRDINPRRDQAFFRFVQYRKWLLLI